MRIIFEQTFPLGRFHANPWRAFAFDDPHGEWPPSPWRLMRAILARSFQLDRELGTDNSALREELVHVFSTSEISWRLPICSWRGPGLQQYQPSEFKKIPAAAAKPGEVTYNTTKVKDSFWLTPAVAQPVLWFFDGEWQEDVFPHLDECLARMIYFGRAESITLVQRVKDGGDDFLNRPQANCTLRDNRTATSVPVLCPTQNVTLVQLCATTADDPVANATTPPGAIWKYAVRPTVVKTVCPRKPDKERPPKSMLQFAIGGRVFPPQKYWLRITERFRGIVLRQIAIQETGDRSIKFHELPSNIREKYALLAGKDTDTTPLSGHRHASLFLFPDSTGNPSRLICWRKVPFTAEEQNAFLIAAETPLAWDFGSDEWKLRLVPLPNETPFPPDSSIFDKSRIWQSLTPFVPPRHVFGRNGKPKSGCEIETQVREQLASFGLPPPLGIETIGEPQWIKVHRTSRCRTGATNDDKRGYALRLTFASPVSGPLCLGHSSHFGLGLFAAVPEAGES